MIDPVERFRDLLQTHEHRVADAREKEQRTRGPFASTEDDPNASMQSARAEFEHERAQGNAAYSRGRLLGFVEGLLHGRVT